MKKIMLFLLVLVVISIFAGSAFSAIYYPRGAAESSNISKGTRVYRLPISESEAVSVPEPTSMLLFGTGLLSLVGLARKKLNLNQLKKMIKVLSLILLWRQH